MDTAITLMTAMIIILTLMTVALIVLGVIQRQKRALFFVGAGMFGFMALLMATTSYFVLQTLPQ